MADQTWKPETYNGWMEEQEQLRLEKEQIEKKLSDKYGDLKVMEAEVLS